MKREHDSASESLATTGRPDLTGTAGNDSYNGRNCERPTVARSELIEKLLDVASDSCRRHGHRLHIQKSAASESVYLRVQRDGHWFGLRISYHPAAHNSSADFQQLLVPAEDPVTSDFAQITRHRIHYFVREGGTVVADPDETEAEIQKCFLRQEMTSRRRMPSVSEICAVRNRLNLRARWSYEVQQAEQTDGK